MAISDELRELNAIWLEVMKSFTEELPMTSIDLMFTPLTLSSFENNTITFTSPSALMAKIVREGHIKRIKDGFREFLGFDVDVSVVFIEDFKNGVKPEEKKKEITITHSESDKGTFGITRVSGLIERKDLIDEDAPVRRPRHEVEVGSDSFPFRFEYTFNNFIVGESNKFAHSACLAVSENPACVESDRISGGKEFPRTFNPLFIYGPSGIGKTHLLHAVINRIKENFPTAKILYITCEDFTNQLISHLSSNSMAQFKEKYRNCDVLLIDDIQFIAGKASTQEEFFHTFNALYDDHKQIILTSDRPPREIKPLEDRLITRFEMGLLADIQTPDMELRVAIIKKKAEQIGIIIPEDVLEYLAENLRFNVRQIEGAIKKLAALSFLSGKTITFELAKGCISELLGGEEPLSVILDRIFKVCEKYYSVSKADILSENRKKEVAHARHVVTYLIKEITDMSYPKLARVTNRKNHSTCISSCHYVEEKLRKEAGFVNEIDTLKKEISSKI